MGVEPTLSEELLVRPHLHDPALVKDHDRVGIPHGGQAVRDHQRGASAREPLDGLAHGGLAQRVQM